MARRRPRFRRYIRRFRRFRPMRRIRTRFRRTFRRPSNKNMNLIWIALIGALVYFFRDKIFGLFSKPA